MRSRNMLYNLSFLLIFMAGFSQKNSNSISPLQVYKDKGIAIKSFDFNGLEAYLKPQGDTIYVVNFWATWCTPCVEELPHFEKLNADFKDKKVKVILVSLDMSKQVLTRLIPFIEKNKIKSDVVLLNDVDADAWINKVDSNWSGALPATLIYNAQKRKFFEQSFTYETLLTQLNTFLSL